MSMFDWIDVDAKFRPDAPSWVGEGAEQQARVATEDVTNIGEARERKGTA